jgi:hypothetical protein
MEEGALVDVSKPHLCSVCEDREDYAREDPPPREKGKSTDRVT